MRGWLAAATLTAFAVLACGFGSGVLTPVSVTPTGSGFDTAAADRFVQGYLHRTGLPRAAVAVVQGDRVVHLAETLTNTLPTRCSARLACVPAVRR